MTPWLSVVIPTVGRATLPRLLDSIDQQDKPVGDLEVLVVGDTHGGLTPELRAAALEVGTRGPTYRWLEHDGDYHAWGHPQRQFGMSVATAPWIAFSQDDNLLTSAALSAIGAAIAALPRPRPILFQVRTWQAGVVWREPTLAVGNIDADGVVVPNDPSRFGTWALEYEGDFAFIQQTINRYGGEVAYCPALIALGRPSAAEDWTL